VLCALLGLAWILGGLMLFVSFFQYHMPDSEMAIATGPVGFYFVAFTGCALVAWGGCLLSAAVRPEGARGIGIATAFALVLCAIYRMAAWIVGDYTLFPGDLLRVEPVVFLVLALAFVWLRPRPLQREVTG
jgi:Na+-translocating ferredoxin:NAD+ oxidoreductase RnfA subunit